MVIDHFGHKIDHLLKFKVFVVTLMPGIILSDLSDPDQVRSMTKLGINALKSKDSTSEIWVFYDF